MHCAAAGVQARPACLAHRTARAARPACAPATAPPSRCRSSSSAAGASSPASPRLQQVLDGIDALNRADPRSTDVGGQSLPYEFAYSTWLTAWVQQLEPAPSEELRIVARGQHVERWKLPRSSHPEGRAGYLQWRERLKAMHAATVTGLMQQAGYDAAACDKVTRFILKKDLKSDPENQVVEDALCLVFLQHQFADLLAKEGPDKMVDVVKKTWRKMGQRGRDAALTLALPPDQAGIVQRALTDA